MLKNQVQLPYEQLLTANTLIPTTPYHQYSKPNPDARHINWGNDASYKFHRERDKYQF